MRNLSLSLAVLLVLCGALSAVALAATATPSTIPSGGTTQLAAPSEYDWGGTDGVLPVETWLWSSGGLGGTFTPNADVQSPTWTANGNLTGAPVNRNLSVTLSRAGLPDVLQSVTVVEEAAVHSLTVTATATPTSTTVGTPVVLIASAVDNYGHSGAGWTYAWTDDAGGMFDGGASYLSAVYYPPLPLALAGGTVRLTVTVTCPTVPAAVGTANLTLTVTPSDPAEFGDVPADHWAHDAIRACAAAGIVQGYPSGTYHPDETVTRAQMAVYLARALGLLTAE